MFEEKVRRALDYVARGVSVRIVGGPGSGKSTVLQSIAAGLEKAGFTVYSLSGSRLLNDTPFAGIGALGLEGRGQENGPLGVANVLAEQLAQRGARAIVVDDIDELDKESAAVIDIVQRRTERPLVVTMDDAPLDSGASVFTPARWPETTMRLSPLHYDQVNKLLAQTLGSPPDVDLTTAVLMKSGGNPRLVVRIAQSAELSKQLVLHDGQWSMSGHTLWNEYLQSTVQELLHGLSADERTALHTLSVVGARPLGSLKQIVEADILDRLEMGAAARLRRSISKNSSGNWRNHNSAPGSPKRPRPTQQRSSSSTGAVRSIPHASNKSSAKPRRLGADSGDHFFFAMTRALWAIVSGGEASAATGILQAIGQAHPDWKAEAQAFALYLEASFDRMPVNLDETLDRLRSRHPESGVLPVIRGILELYRFDAQAALRALDSADGFDLAAGMEPFIRGLAIHIAGHGEEAVIFSLSQRAAARRALDQFGFVANS